MDAKLTIQNIMFWYQKLSQNLVILLCMDSNIYTGQETKLNEIYCNLPVSSQVVMTLLDPLLEKRHCLTIDNLCISSQAAVLLVSNRTDIYGTVKKSWKDMSLQLKKLKKEMLLVFRVEKSQQWYGKIKRYFISVFGPHYKNGRS